MKTKILIILLLFSFLSKSQDKRTIIKQIRAYKKELVMDAKYNQKISEVYSAMYQVVSQEYNNITKESESRGYVEAKQEKDNYREYVVAEISGSQAPYRVNFSIKSEKRSKKEDGSWNDWSSSDVDDNYITKIYTSLYEKLNGKIQLSDELKKEVDDWNGKQEKERHKIEFGKDY